MAETADWVLAAAALTAAGVTVCPRTGTHGARMVQAMGFLLLGTLAALIWLRLGSVDVSLAEAALGGGMLGAVLVFLAAAPRRLRKPPPLRPTWWKPTLGVVTGGALTLVLSAVWLRVEQTMPHWSEPLAEQMPVGGQPAGSVTHGVTGVLLAFRAYDTLLESAVLMLAGAAALALRREAAGSTLGGAGGVAAGHPVGPVLSTQTTGLVWLTRMISPVLLLVGLWLLFAGSTDSGGAFQSGAVLAAMLILLRVSGLAPRWLGAAHYQRVLQLTLVIGVVVFILAGLLGPLAGQAWLGWEEDWAFAAILTVEIMLTVGIAAGLYAVYVSLEDAEGVGQP